MSQSKFILLAMLLGSGWTAAAQSPRATDHIAVVKSDRVNLRARPAMDSEVVAQANTGERLPVAGILEEWIEVTPPDAVDVWAHRDFIKDGTSTVKSLNLRAGPGINYSIVGTLNRGEAVQVRGQFGEWLSVAPDRATVWVSKEFVDVVTPIRSDGTAPVPVSEPAPPAAPAPGESATEGAELLPPPQPVELSGAQDPAFALPPGVPAPPADLRLVPLDGQGRSVRREGELRPAPLLFGRPSSFRLVKREGVQVVTVCYVRGNTAQLNSLMNERLVVQGREYWVQGVRQPVVVLERIERHAASTRP